MANVDAPFGARPLRRRGGGNIHINKYYVNVSDALYVGDIVSMEGTADSEGVPSVIACTPCLIPAGVIVGFEASKDVIDTQLYKKAGDAMYCYVADDPDLIFEIQTDAAIVAGDFGLNGDLVFTEGSTDTGRSKMEFDVGTKATTSALHMKLLRLSKYPDNEIGDAAIVECCWSQHAQGLDAATGV
jgi:hypothetical protein